MFEWLKKLLGNSNEAEVKKLSRIVDQVEALEDSYKQLTDEQLRAKTDEFRPASTTAKPRTTSSPRPLPPSARLRGVPWACAPTACR